MSLHDQPAWTRPREKMQEKGPEGLKNSELLAILLRTGYKGRTAVEVAERLLKQHSLTELAGLPLSELSVLKGVGFSRAATIKTAFYLAQLISHPLPRTSLLHPTDVVKLLGHLVHKKQEHVIGLYLDARHQLISQNTLTVGTVNASLLHAREVFAPALEQRATAIILVHNHPSGNSEPSDEDFRATEKLSEAGHLLDIPLIDHLILSHNSWYSFREQGQLE